MEIIVLWTIFSEGFGVYFRIEVVEQSVESKKSSIHVDKMF